MIDTLALVKEASYAFLPQLLARGNFRQPKSSGYFPVCVGEGAVQTGFTMYNMQAPDGFDPVGGCIRFGGVDEKVESTSASIPNDPLSTFVDFYQNRTSSTDDVVVSVGGGAFNIGHYNTTHRFVVSGSHLADTYIVPVTPFPSRNSVYLVRDNGWVYRSISGQSLGAVDTSKGQMTDSNNYNDLRLGSQTGANRFFSGYIKTALIFPRALSQEEVTHLHEQSLLGFPGLRADAYGPNNEFARISRTRRRSFGLGRTSTALIPGRI